MIGVVRSAVVYEWHAPAWAYLAAGIALLIAMAVAGVLVWRRHRRKQPPPLPPLPPAHP